VNAALGAEVFGRDDIAQLGNLGRTDKGGHQSKIEQGAEES
jgi:hypothetical protein